MSELIAKPFLVRPGMAVVAAISSATDEEEFGFQYRPADDAGWTDLFENGKPVVANTRNTCVWLKAPGQYRAVANTPIVNAEVNVTSPFGVTYFINASNG